MEDAQKYHMVVEDAQKYHMVVEDGAALAARWAAGEFALYRLNRAVDGPRAAEIGRAVAARGLGPTPFVIATTAAGAFLIDGQHRLHALARLGAAAAGVTAFVCTVACADDDDVFAEFRLVNCGTPLPPAYTDMAVRAVLEGVVGRLAAAYPGAVSTAAACMRPNFIPRQAIDALSESRHVREAILIHGATAASLFDLLSRMNDEFRRDSAAVRVYAVTLKMTAKAASSGFYLGLAKGWVDLVSARV